MVRPEKWIRGNLRYFNMPKYCCDAKQEEAGYEKDMYPEMWAKTGPIQIFTYSTNALV
jgi:hypothetical protein